ncbi:acetylornithine transaminase [Mobiluncus mulieris]|uniref:Acetylornithine transaminase n=1 Tax=Mobiluncus mulieris TaxID=2052 RepID=A0ABD4TYW0_9ACTO|nr:acetylornithine transaminase [Mobiluncus mulieris]MCU9968996.1 acetylornithine transaminase [Mobiluncus mulieris]
MQATNWTKRFEDAVMNACGHPLTVMARGAGCFVWDEYGHQYLDLAGGIGVNSLGHAHPNVVKALTAQAQTLGHVGNAVASSVQIEAAEKLLSIVEPGGAAPESRVFFTNSGSESIETAFKIVRVYAEQASHEHPNDPPRTRILALENGFHGCASMGALSLASKKALREPFLPLPAAVEFIPYAMAALERAFEGERGRNIAALFIEPIQGVGGVRVLSEHFLRLARDVTAEAGALLVFDEIQCGMGRTGTWMAHHLAGVTPDIVTLGGGLGAGFPVGACLALNDTTATALAPGLHSSTFGGNPLAAASVLATINTIEEEKLLTNVVEVNEIWTRELMGLHHPLISDVRGRGLMLGIGLKNPVAKPLAVELFREGFLVDAPDTFTLRLAPPLIISAPQTRMFTQSLPEIIDRVVQNIDHQIAQGQSATQNPYHPGASLE